MNKIQKKDWRKIQLKLLKKKNVVAVGLGVKVKLVGGLPVGIEAVICSVVKKMPSSQLKKKDVIPYKVAGIVTDVVETGVIEALKSRTRRWRPAPGGVSIGHELISVGTLGCLVKKKNEEQIYILSNNHILANSNEASIGDAILQPGKYDGGKLGLDRIATLADFVPIKFEGTPDGNGCKVGNAVAFILNLLAGTAKRQSRIQLINTETPENLVDAAIARPLRDSAVSKNIISIGIRAGLDYGYVGMQIQKSGRTTELTKGEILQIDVAVRVSYGEGKIALFVDQFMAGDMSAGGDSGSVVLDMDRGLIGLLFAGGENTTIINPIHYVFEKLKLEL